MTKKLNSFSVGDDILELIQRLDSEQLYWIILRWAADFHEKNQRPAYLSDLLRSYAEVLTTTTSEADLDGSSSAQ